MIDDLIQDEVQRGGSPRLEPITLAGQTLTRACEIRTGAVTDNHDEIQTDKKMQLAKRYVAGLYHGRLAADEKMIAIFIKLGPLVRGQRVFQRKLVQTQFLAKRDQQATVRGLNIEPDEILRITDDLADIRQGNFAG